MSDQREIVSDQREVVVRDGGSGAGVILGVILLLVLIAVGWYFLLGPGTATGPGSLDINVQLPSAIPSLPAAS
jgi:hypothetical protein